MALSDAAKRRLAKQLSRGNPRLAAAMRAGKIDDDEDLNDLGADEASENRKKAKSRG